MMLSLVRRFRRLLVAPLLVLAGAAAAEMPPAPPWRAPLDRQHPLAGRIWITAERKAVSPDELVARLSQARFVLLGEKHDNPDHHALQAWLVRRLIASGRRPAVAFEMFGTDKSKAISTHLAANPGDAAGLGPATGWDKTGWPDWAMYSPIAQAALDAGLPVLGANLPDHEAQAITRRQTVRPERVDELVLDRPLSAKLHADLVDDLRRSHCNMLPETMISPMVMAQRAKDGSMARTMSAAVGARDVDTVVLIAGSGHARTDRGVPLALSWLAPQATVFSVAFVEVDGPTTDPAAYAGLRGEPAMPFDALWFTARVEGQDPCALLADHMKKRKEKEKK